MGAYSRPIQPFTVQSRDSLAIRGVHLPGGRPDVFIYAHGFLANKGYAAIPRFVEMLAERADAVAFDFRGHGESQGASTLGERELLDLEAVVDYAIKFGYHRVFLVGSSMGGAVALRYAARSPEISGVSTIGAFADGRFSLLGRTGIALGRMPVSRPAIARLRGARIESLEPEAMPVDAIGAISPRPVLLIHGELDPLVPLRHARALYAAAGEPRKLLIIPRGLHDIPNLNVKTRDWIYEWMGVS